MNALLGFAALAGVPFSPTRHFASMQVGPNSHDVRGVQMFRDLKRSLDRACRPSVRLTGQPMRFVGKECDFEQAGVRRLGFYRRCGI
jgi:hypothetical protein